MRDLAFKDALPRHLVALMRVEVVAGEGGEAVDVVVGVRRVVMERHQVPLVQMNILVRSGVVTDPAGKEGTAASAPIAFEVASVLLLAAMIGAVYLAFNKK